MNGKTLFGYPHAGSGVTSEKGNDVDGDGNLIERSVVTWREL